MRALFALLLALPACTLILNNRALILCDGNEPRCEGNELVQCAQGIQIRAECTQGSCDATLNACVGFCGDGAVDPGESCDDGSLNSDITPNACRADCTNPFCGDEIVDTDFDEACDPPGKFACDDLCQEIVICGDGFIRGDEACDDGNLSNTDACKNDCTQNVCGDGALLIGVEPCDDGDDDNTDACIIGCALNICGDGFAFEGVEECEDANLVNDDGCSDQCETERCGDRAVQSDEECDDGNTIETDSCTSQCELNVCGDGLLLEGIEECDDGNNINTDSCTQGCLRAVCGDGFFFLNQEVCEGAELNGQTCITQGFVDGDLACSVTCQFDTSNCLADASCGDGVVDNNEECDDQNTSNSDACLSNCQDAECGDGFIINGVEGCDDNNTINTDACTAQCQPNVCGDGSIFTGTEDCEDGNANDADACVNCQFASCGDGVVRQDITAESDPNFEGCEDQNTSNTDGCTNDCRTNLCGDGFLFEGVEACDDGNILDGDGCEADCSLPVDAACGDGITEGIEECDDGNVADNDGCSEFCSLEADLFVRCSSGAPIGDGSLELPFSSLTTAVANQNVTIMLLPSSTACGPVIINRSLIIQGLAIPDPTGNTALPIIDGGTQAALSVTAGTVTLRSLRLLSDSSNSTIGVSGNAKLAVLSSVISNSNGLAADCSGSSGARLLIHQSSVVDNADGGIQVGGSCRAVVASSLLQNNGDASATQGAIQLEQTAEVSVIFSVFDNNAGPENSVMGGCISQRGKIDSSIINNTNPNPVDSSCAVSFTNSFGASLSGSNNINANPLFESGFHLAPNSPCRNTANPANLTLSFDPVGVFNVDVFAADFANQPRPTTARDMGMFEEP